MEQQIAQGMSLGLTKRVVCKLPLAVSVCILLYLFTVYVLYSIELVLTKKVA